MPTDLRFAIVTGASTGIGLELAKCCAKNGFDLDTNIGAAKKDDAGDVAQIGYDAMMSGEGDVVSGWKNKVETTLANVTPSSVLAKQHLKMAEPGSAKN